MEAVKNVTIEPEVIDPSEAAGVIEVVEDNTQQTVNDTDLNTGDGEVEGKITETVVTIGDEEPEETGAPPQWAKDLRKSYTETSKENKQLKKQLKSLTNPDIVAPGKKPELEDFDVDPEKYDAALLEWYDKDRAYKDQIKSQEDKEKEAEQSWLEVLSSHNEKKAALSFEDIDESEHFVSEIMSQSQQGMILDGSDNSALVMHVLHKNPKRAKELSLIQNPVKFSVALGKLEASLKVTKRTPATQPEKILKGSGSTGGNITQTLERLRAEAEKTGDITKVTAFKREHDL